MKKCENIDKNVGMFILIMGVVCVCLVPRRYLTKKIFFDIWEMWEYKPLLLLLLIVNSMQY